MKVKISAKNIPMTDGMKEEAERRLDVIQKFIGKDGEIKLSVSSTKRTINLGAMFVYDGKLVKLQKSGEDYYELLNEMADGMKVKLERLHTKKVKKQQDQERALDNIGYDFEADEIDAMNLIVKKKKVMLESMTPEEAVKEMEELGHESFIFKNSITGAPCMVYTRNDAKYGLIEAS